MAFAPSSRQSTLSALNASPELQGMVGASVETGNKIVSEQNSLFLSQIGQSTSTRQLIAYHYTKNFSLVQWDPLNISDQLPPSFAREAELANGRAAMLATVGYVFPKYIYHFPGTVSTEDPIAAIFQADPQWWAQFLVLCATIEGYKYRESLKGNIIDYAKLYPKNEAKQRDIELKELKNGRLAMIGIAGFVAAHFIPGSVPIAPQTTALPLFLL